MIDVMQYLLRKSLAIDMKEASMFCVVNLTVNNIELTLEASIYLSGWMSKVNNYKNTGK